MYSVKFWLNNGEEYTRNGIYASTTSQAYVDAYAAMTLYYGIRTRRNQPLVKSWEIRLNGVVKDSSKGVPPPKVSADFNI